ncbi:hypothetical protein PDESU_04783 [Pontiella desulfatans]|uniref:Uncharacterized protein n=1 Tax=Pontiella desulfatans TaxID=2750659 RepID=A0A6C2U8N8_PONDE|nr:hypothetical protein [Pontiella desulfatans]VGO16193.1 hypothetical protein PDESU_04783 [Pontiella desulfatans]
MLKAVEATIETDGHVRLLEQVHLTHPCRAIVTIVDAPDVPESALLAEQALAEDWNRSEEDKAWSHLQ